MSALARRVRRALEIGPAEVVRRLTERASAARERDRERAVANVTPWKLDLDDAPVPIARIVELPDRVTRTPEQLAACERYLEHRFDLLGSGWVSWALPAETAGPLEMLRPEDRDTASAVRSLISPGFAAIDWQRDPVSGERWSERTWFGDIDTEGRAPADVKYPWELARCQHLPQLALAFAENPASSLGARAVSEVRDTILDFIAANPCGWGVDWACAMDVAIRVANWLLACDIARAAGHDFDPAFERVLAASAAQHAEFVATHLEWRRDLLGNHYLADVAGLAWAAAYLPEHPSAHEWLTLASQELREQTQAQFAPDGTNFEGSTAYHRLSAELAVYGLAVAARVTGEPLAPALVQRIAGMAEFARDTTAPDGRLVQIGDNDSGRFFKLTPRFSGPDLAEEVSDASHLLASAGALAGRDDLVALAPAHALEAHLVRAIAGDRTVVAATQPVPRDAAPAAGGPDPAIDPALAPEQGTPWTRVTFPAPAGPSLLDGLELRTYPSFGLYLWRSPRLFLSVRCGAIGQNGLGGHDHNDQLGIELWVDGCPVVRDPGTATYTADPARRDRYRSVAAHFAPQVGTAEPARLGDLFSLPGATPAVCVRADATGFLGYLDAYSTRVWRSIEIAPDAITVSDIAENGEPVCSQARPVPYSPGYGIVMGTDSAASSPTVTASGTPERGGASR